MNDRGNVMGKWNYGTTPQFPYGEDTTYRKAMEFLDGPWIIEDWGCGTAYARNFVKKGRYIGVDGSWSMHCDQVADLRIHRSRPNAILMRHILEHNWDWKQILQNALDSFQDRFCLVMFTPFSEETKKIGDNFGGAVPDLSFKKEDLLALMAGFDIREESVPSGTQYGTEHIFYVTRKPGARTNVNDKVSIIIPTYNHFADCLLPNIETLKAQTDLEKVEVIIVANGCTDETENYARKLGSPFTLIAFRDPIGFTKATNAGIKASHGSHLIFVNNDVEFLPQPKHQWVNQLLAPFQGSPEMGITGPLQLFDHYAGQDVIVGSCLCISRKALEAAGGLLDEVFSPGGGEDVDLCCKVRAAGFTVRQVPKEGVSGKQWQNVDGNFMIWHKNNRTFRDMPDYWSKTVKQNGIVNLNRHNKNIKLNVFAEEEHWPYLSVSQAWTGAQVPMNSARLNLLDGSVSEILSIDVTRAHPEHDPSDLFWEWFRVLKSGGKLIVEAAMPTDVPEHWKANYRSRIYWWLEDRGFRYIEPNKVLYMKEEPEAFHFEATKP